MIVNCPDAHDHNEISDFSEDLSFAEAFFGKCLKGF